MKKIVLTTDEKNNTLNVNLEGSWSEIEVRGALAQAERGLNEFVASKRSRDKPLDLSEFK